MFLYTPPMVRAYNSANIATTTGTTTALTFDSERFDTDTMHSTSSSTGRITFTTAGEYLNGAQMQYEANVTGIRDCKIRLGGSTFIVFNRAQAVSAAGPLVTGVVAATLYQFAATNYTEAVAEQTSGGNLNVEAAGNHSPEFWACWQGN